MEEVSDTFGASSWYYWNLANLLCKCHILMKVTHCDQWILSKARPCQVFQCLRLLFSGFFPFAWLMRSCTRTECILMLIQAERTMSQWRCCCSLPNYAHLLFSYKDPTKMLITKGDITTGATKGDITSGSHQRWYHWGGGSPKVGEPARAMAAIREKNWLITWDYNAGIKARLKQCSFAIMHSQVTMWHHSYSAYFFLKLVKSAEVKSLSPREDRSWNMPASSERRKCSPLSSRGTNYHCTDSISQPNHHQNKPCFSAEDMNIDTIWKRSTWHKYCRYW